MCSVHEMLRRQRYAIIEDFQLIKDSLEIINAFRNERKIIDSNFHPFFEHLLISLEHLIIIRLWNLISDSNNCKHNLNIFTTNIDNNIDVYTKQIWPELPSREKRDEQTKYLHNDIKTLKECLSDLKKDGFYGKINNWRDQFFTHFDDDKVIGMLYYENETQESKDYIKIREQWLSDNYLPIDEIEGKVKMIYMIVSRMGIGRKVINYNSMDEIINNIINALKSK